MSERARLQAQLILELQALGVPSPSVDKVQFHPVRNWRFDLAWPDVKLAVEIDGGSKGKSAHFSRRGFARDQYRSFEAWRLGWHVVRVNYLMLAKSPDKRVAGDFLKRSGAPTWISAANLIALTYKRMVRHDADRSLDIDSSEDRVAD